MMYAPFASRFLARPDLFGRAGVTVAATACGLLGLPAPVLSVLIAVAAGLTLERLVRLYRSSAADILLVSAASLLLTLLGLGVVLDHAPGGISRIGWYVGACLASLAALAWCSRFPPPPRLRLASWRQAPRAAAWYTAGILLVIVGLALSVDATRLSERTSVELSVEEPREDAVEIVVRSGVAAGPFDLFANDGTGEQLLQTSFRLDPSAPRRYTLPVQKDKRVTVTLRAPSQERPVRTVVVQPDPHPRQG